jgi:uncharacterized metal-binding protein YceD (DUF177 family)
VNDRQISAPEFYRPLAVERLARLPCREALRADAEECHALARRFKIPALESLEACITLTKGDGPELILLSGDVRAELTLNCGVSLVPFQTLLEETFVQLLALSPEAIEGFIRRQDEVREEDLPELVEESELDLGELVAQYLSLAIEPHPRRADASLPASWLAASERATDEMSPFSQLRHLKMDRA